MEYPNWQCANCLKVNPKIPEKVFRLFWKKFPILRTNQSFSNLNIWSLRFGLSDFVSGIFLTYKPRLGVWSPFHHADPSFIIEVGPSCFFGKVKWCLIPNYWTGPLQQLHRKIGSSKDPLLFLLSLRLNPLSVDRKNAIRFILEVKLFVPLRVIPAKIETESVEESFARPSF